jgi:iron complex outermembrane receptor protein
MKTNHKSLALALTVASGTLATPVLAENLALEEVIVTAQKRAESLQDVPISMAYVSGEALEKAGLTTVEQLSATLPNFTVTQEQITDRISIRGIASGGNQGFDQSVGMFSNGVYLPRGEQIRSAFLDVGAVEVLRGPQATLFGKNTIAGAVNVTPRKPTEEFESQIKVKYETEYESTGVSGFVSGALSKTLSARLAFDINDNGGFVENVVTGTDDQDSESTNFRLSFEWSPTDNLTAYLSHEQYSFEGDGKPIEVIHDEIINADGTVGGSQCRFTDCDYNYSNGVTNVDGTPGFDVEAFSDLDTGLTTLRFDYDIDGYTVTAISGYSTSELDEMNPGQHRVPQQTNANQLLDFEQFSQELRIVSPTGGTIDWLAGFYYETNELKFDEGINIHAVNLLGGELGPNNLSIGTDFDQESDTLAAFSQATWNISDSVRTTFGLRYGKEEKDATQIYSFNDLAAGSRLADVITEAGAAATAANFNFDESTSNGSRTQENWSPSINVQWDLNEDVLLYASTSIGYKSGGFDARMANSETSDFEFDEEKATTYEIGTKTTLLDGAAEVNAAIFHTEYEDLQFSAFNGGFAFIVDNAANATLQGLEVDFRWRANEKLTLSGGGAYLDFEFEDFLNGPCNAYETAAYTGAGACSVDLSGESSPNTPEFSFNLNADWVQPLADAMELNVILSMNYEDEFRVSQDVDPILSQDAYAKYNLRVALNSTDDTWSVSVLGSNLTNEKTFHYGNDVPSLAGGRFVLSEAPRTITLEGSYRF